MGTVVGAHQCSRRPTPFPKGPTTQRLNSVPKERKNATSHRDQEVTSELSAVTFDVIEAWDGAVRFDVRGVTELTIRLMRDLEVMS
jgi:hypothetical protein